MTPPWNRSGRTCGASRRHRQRLGLHRIRPRRAQVLDGQSTIFLKALGYQLDEINGKHHRLFVDPAYANHPAYSQVLERSEQWQNQADVYKRIRKGGREIWIQAVYAPVKDDNGRVVKVVKICHGCHG